MTATTVKRCACGRTISANKEACRECISVPVRSGGGVLEILNVQGGDVKITFDKGNAGEVIRTKRIIQDMLRRGYALVVEVEREGKMAYERVQEFDSERGEYIIADFDSLEAAKADACAPPVPREPIKVPTRGGEDAPVRRRGRPPGKRLAMETTKATGIGRSAGG